MTMSNRSLHQYRKPAHRRDGSSELDVFEAAQYFSGSADAVRLKERVAWEVKEVKSFDGHVRSPVPSQCHRVEKLMKEKQLKQPLSPGGRLASFLNSFFHQTSGSKKKSKSKSNTTTTLSVKDEEEEKPAGGRSKRRNSCNSISQFQSTRSSESRSMYSCPGTGFRTPTPYINTPVKVYKDLNIHPNIKSNGQLKSVTSFSQSELPDDKINAMDVSRHGGRSKHNSNFLEKSRLSTNGLLEEEASGLHSKRFLEEEGLSSSGFVERRWVLNKNRKGSLVKDMVLVDGLTPRQKYFWRSEEIGDGGESDSSSDLFDLPNYDLGGFSSGLPVYESTTVKNISCK